VIGLLAFGLTRDPGQIVSPLPGREAPPFALQVFADPGAHPPRETISLDDLRNQIVVLNFWASWCLPCREEHAALSNAATKYAGSDVQFVGVLYNDVAEGARRWIAAMGGQTYPSLLDPGSRTAIDYGLYGVPETFFIARDGKVAYKHIGPVTSQLIAQKIDSLLRASDIARGTDEGR
jgi:cytochrome c biogenesis protein CcmG/thiol:disulfide interchange protein DsbE